MSDLDANFDNQLAAFMGGEKVNSCRGVKKATKYSSGNTQVAVY